MLKVAKKYILAFEKANRNEISNLIAKEGSFEMIEIQKDNKEEQTLKNLQEAEYKLATLDFTIGYLAPFAKKPPLLSKIKNPKILIKRSLECSIGKENIFQEAKRIEKIEKKLDVLKKEEKDNLAAFIDLEKFNGLTFSPQDTKECFFLVIGLSKIQNEKFSPVAKENNLHQKHLTSLMAKEIFLIAGLKTEKEKIISAIKGLKGEVLPYNYEKTPAQERMDLQNKLEEIEKTIVSLQKELEIKAKNLENFKIYRDVLAIEKTNWEIKNKTMAQGLLDYIVFWGYEKETAVLKKKVLEISENAQVIELALEKGEEPRVILENHKLIKPFQYVTEIFGMPKPGEIDPTPYLALFFILFFGVCLTDAGYGILLIVFTALPLIFFKKTLSNNMLLKLLFYGGISTLAMGVLFGSYFGSTTQTLQKFPFLYKLKMLDPIEDTVLFMALSFGIGYLQVAFAQVIKIISGRKNNNKEMLLNGLAWLIFYCSLVFFIIYKIKIPSLKNIAFPFLAGSIGFLIFAESLGQKIFLKPLVGSIKILQGIIGTISDVLSYSRLVALGLATAVIALIVNQIAFLLGGMVPYVGWILTVLVLIGGHIFNLVINALGAFIHSGRLQFVEFFPKFLEGGGKRFNPIKPELKYIKVI